MNMIPEWAKEMNCAITVCDKEGVIINNNMSRPSSDDTIRTLEALDGIR